MIYSTSVYYLIDLTHEDAATYLAELAAATPAAFTPRKNIAETQAFVQVKQGFRGYRVSGVSWLSSPGPAVLGSGSADWAKAIFDDGYTPATGNAWNLSDAAMDL